MESLETPATEADHKAKQHASQVGSSWNRRGTTVMRDDGFGLDDMDQAMSGQHFLDDEYDDRGRRWDQMPFTSPKPYSSVDDYGEDLRDPYIQEQRAPRRSADDLSGIRSDLPLNQ
mmetsp:Transcript_1843/g.2490  ORF Transcript_1843/g.2490 Transcript_1843/m.2490 type:complete len:116 (+) Transcript_1843:428-775(+)